jgi:hypothetical protein
MIFIACSIVKERSAQTPAANAEDLAEIMTEKTRDGECNPNA